MIRSRRLLVACAIALGLTVALMWLVGTRPTFATASLVLTEAKGAGCRPLWAPGDVVTVCLSGECDYTSVQAAVDAAKGGDIIKVAAGTYTDVSARGGVKQMVYISKSVTIRGGYTTGNWDTPDPEANPTTLDAQGQGRVLYITGDITPTVEGLRITGGYGYLGGGIYVLTATATIRNNQVFGNIALANGGGLYLHESDATLSRNIISDNIANDWGGGLCLGRSDAMLSGNTFSGNVADHGGGLHLFLSKAVLSGNTFSGNISTGRFDPWWLGGGGGGLHLEHSDATLTNDLIADNQTSGRGGGLSVVGSSLSLLHTTIARNSSGDGSGVNVAGYTDYLGTKRYSAVTLTNVILVSHTVGISTTGGNTVTVNGVLWDSSTPITVSKSTTAIVRVQNQRTGAPSFAPDGYHLTIGSAAIGRGMDMGVTTDIDGDPRPAPVGTRPDLGADEISQRQVHLPLVLRSH